MGRLITCGWELAGSVAAAPTGYELTAVSDTGSQLSIQGTTKRSGSYALKCALTSTTAASCDIQFASAVISRAYLRFYIYVSSSPSESTVAALLSGTGAIVAEVTISGNVLTLYNQAGSHTVLSSNAITTNEWHRVEVVYDTSLGAGLGIIQMAVDGGDLGGTTTASQTTGTKTLRLGGNLNVTESSGTWYFDDIALNDPTGTAQSNLPGEGRVVHLWPNGDGDADTACTRSSGSTTPTGTDRGSNYLQLGATYDKPSPNDATDFLLLTANNSEVLVDCEASSVPGIATTDKIKLVQVGGRIAAASGTATNWIPEIESQAAGTKSTGATTVVNTTSFSTHDDTATTAQYKLTSYADPQGGGPWTPALLDTMQIGSLGTDGNPDMLITALWALIEYVNPVLVAAGSVAFTGQTPTVIKIEGALPVPAGSFAISGNAPAVHFEIKRAPAAGAFAFTGQGPAALVPVIKQPAAKALAIGTPTPRALIPVFPVADLQTGDWAPTPLYPRVSQNPFNDASYITSGGGSACHLDLPEINGTGVTSLSIHVRARSGG